MRRGAGFFLFLIVFTSLWMGSIGCKNTDAPLKPKAIRLVDTLVAHQWKIIEPKQDSICDSNFDRIYAQAYDSIMTLRLLEKNELIQYEVK